ncbi:hypothetical protein, partial [Umezakia ovalisporum]|uniref:hypothetical protein n=1 Tax=Umezakia ovalisporum TaxID=75695 RepID=UPI0039C6CE78
MDAFYSIDFTTDNHVLLAGGTNSIDFPTTAGVIQPNYAGGRADGLMVVLSENGNAILKASYFGTSEYD